MQKEPVDASSWREDNYMQEEKYTLVGGGNAHTFVFL